MVIVVAAITSKQFYTLTEKVDVLTTQKTMLQQSNQISNGKSIAEYLNENRPELRGPTKQETEEELIKQQSKSKKLANEIDETFGDNK